MLQRAKILLFFLLVIQFSGFAQEAVRLNIVKKDHKVLPAKVLNLAYFVANETGDTIEALTDFDIPER